VEVVHGPLEHGRRDGEDVERVHETNRSLPS
jgi:hypothetical protein